MAKLWRPDMDLRTFITAGNATLTVTSKKTGARFTYRVRRMESAMQRHHYFVTLLTGPDNQRDFDYIGMLQQSSAKLPHGAQALGFRHTKGSKVAATSKSFMGFQWLVACLNMEHGQAALERLAEVHHEGKCGRCGRKLTVPESIESGFGPECINKVGG